MAGAHQIQHEMFWLARYFLVPSPLLRSFGVRSCARLSHNLSSAIIHKHWWLECLNIYCTARLQSLCSIRCLKSGCFCRVLRETIVWFIFFNLFFNIITRICREFYSQKKEQFHNAWLCGFAEFLQGDLFLKSGPISLMIHMLHRTVMRGNYQYVRVKTFSCSISA